VGGPSPVTPVPEQNGNNGTGNRTIFQNEDNSSLSQLPPGLRYVEPDMIDANGTHLAVLL